MRGRARHCRPSIGVLAASSLALVASLLVACGGGEEGSASGSVDRGEFLEQADAICVEAAESFVEMSRDPVTSAEEGAARDAEVLELRQESRERLAELTPPAELESAYEAYIALEEELTAVNEELTEAFSENDEEQIQSGLERFEALEDDIDAAAAEVGLTACAGDALSEEDVAEIGSTAREYLTSTDPEICSELATERLITERYEGELQNCEREVERREPPSEVRTSEPSGAGPSATLDAQLPDGETLDIFMVKEDDGWKVDVVNPGA
ncbi:MAG: hypothetical protein M3O70_11095 [Actinomycetota bacterium]|nr:hypothetical protein [Actinomycetota bacterium]